MNNMNGIGSYNAMQKNIYGTASQSRKAAKADMFILIGDGRTVGNAAVFFSCS